MKAINGVTYYFQSLLYDYDVLCLQTPSFVCDGLVYHQPTNMWHMRVHLPEWQQSVLKNIDDHVKDSVTCPETAPPHWQDAFDEDCAYSSLPSTLLLPLSDNFTAWDAFENRRECHELMRGYYSALIQVTGIHYDRQPRHFASLELKVLQLLYLPLPLETCLMDWPISTTNESTPETI